MANDVRREMEACIRNLRAHVLREMDALDRLLCAMPQAPRCIHCIQPCRQPMGPPIPDEPSPPFPPAKAEAEGEATLLPPSAAGFLTDVTGSDAIAPFMAIKSIQSADSYEPRHTRPRGRTPTSLQHLFPPHAQQPQCLASEASGCQAQEEQERRNQDVSVRLQEFRYQFASNKGRHETWNPSKDSPLSKTSSRMELLMVEKEDMGRCFDIIFAGAILTNAALSGVEVQWRANHLREEDPVVFSVLRTVYTVLFLIELVARVCKVGCSQLFCKSEDRSWAWLDLIVVISGIVELGIDAVSFLDWTFGVSDSGRGALKNLRLMRMVRLVRMFRLQRIVRFVAALKTLVYSICVTLKSLFWALFLLSCIMYVFSLTFTMDAIDILEEGRADEATRQIVHRTWGSLDSSMFTLFKSISGGVSWTEPLEPLQEASALSAALFAVYIAFTYFAVLNVVTAVFCSSALESTQRDPDLVARSLVDERKECNKILLSLFGALDMDDSGALSLEEFKVISEDDMVRAYFNVLGIDLHDVWTLFLLMDRNKTGTVDLEEFMFGCEQLRGGATNLHIAEVSQQVAKMNKRMKQLLYMFKQMGDDVVEPDGDPTMDFLSGSIR